MAQEYILKTQGLRDVIQNMKKNFPDGICFFFFSLVNTIGLFINSYQHEDKFEQVYILSIF